MGWPAVYFPAGVFLQIKLCPLQGQAGCSRAGKRGTGAAAAGIPALYFVGLKGMKLVGNWVVAS